MNKKIIERKKRVERKGKGKIGKNKNERIERKRIKRN